MRNVELVEELPGIQIVGKAQRDEVAPALIAAEPVGEDDVLVALDILEHLPIRLGDARLG